MQGALIPRLQWLLPSHHPGLQLFLPPKAMLLPRPPNHALGTLDMDPTPETDWPHLLPPFTQPPRKAHRLLPTPPLKLEKRQSWGGGREVSSEGKGPRC